MPLGEIGRTASVNKIVEQDNVALGQVR